MARWTGFFNKNGSPVLKISLYGVTRRVSKEFEAIVDTGFTGFLAMPMVEAFPLGLILTGTSRTKLADGSTVTDLTALGTAFVGDEEAMGTVSLSSGPGAVLAGMEFLATFAKTLFVYTKAGQAVVVLVDNSEFEQFQAESEREQAGQPETRPGTVVPPTQS